MTGVLMGRRPSGSCPRAVRPRERSVPYLSSIRQRTASRRGPAVALTVATEDLARYENWPTTVMDQMGNATGSILVLNSHPIESRDMHVICDEVLQANLKSMDKAVRGPVRPKVARHITATRRFLEDHGNTQAPAQAETTSG